ncbi:unnamed protein product [Brachionus calyciflorus]|uniref:Uncharacterized protein n=1 Tax=Brachionus calyciflorus TaxID=104777 RepID=A0A813WBA5_9BILA|nr:unnamed protein product [Brachionus calyciflorus]
MFENTEQNDTYNKPIPPDSIVHDIKFKNKIGYLGLLAEMCTNYSREFDYILKSNYSLTSFENSNEEEEIIKKKVKKRKLDEISDENVDQNRNTKHKIFDLLDTNDSEKSNPNLKKSKISYLEKDNVKKKYEENSSINNGSIHDQSGNITQGFRSPLSCKWFSNGQICRYHTYSDRELDEHVKIHRNYALLNDYNFYSFVKQSLNSNKSSSKDTDSISYLKNAENLLKEHMGVLFVVVVGKQ